MRMGRDWQNVAQEVGWVPGQASGAGAWGAPVGEGIGDAVGEGAGKKEEEVGDGEEDAE